ncbi:hypothetical protein VNO78_24332 [Psophocarpus tetragonolobus]|uniref:Uncharacterized protein n=1 Tax=Psophocarpus tetragonolobus TaxID=3891 RepID=A0AAN9XEL2_PSOTE
MAPPFYFPILLIYSASDVKAFGSGYNAVSDKFKTSLSEVLTLYYPFCGRLRDNSTIECNDEGVLFIESKVPIELSNILKNHQLHNMNEIFLLDSYSPKAEERETPETFRADPKHHRSSMHGPKHHEDKAMKI